MTRAVFLDAGHTLLYAHPDLGTIYTQVTVEFGVELPPARFAAVFGPVFKVAVQEYASHSHASDAQDFAMWRSITGRIHEALPELAGVDFEAWFQALYRRFGEASAWSVYDDVVPVLRRLRERGLILGVVSNWDSRLQAISDGLGLTDLVDFLVISARAGVRKPDPGIFRQALEQAGVAPDEALHVGDVPEEDIDGARRAGIRGVLIERRARLPGHPAPAGTPLIRSLHELEALL